MLLENESKEPCDFENAEQNPEISCFRDRDRAPGRIKLVGALPKHGFRSIELEDFGNPNTLAYKYNAYNFDTIARHLM